jgi:hypothetical protein
MGVVVGLLVHEDSCVASIVAYLKNIHLCYNMCAVYYLENNDNIYIIISAFLFLQCLMRHLNMCIHLRMLAVKVPLVQAIPIGEAKDNCPCKISHIS